MKMPSRWMLAMLAVFCAGCIPKITVKFDAQNRCEAKTVSQDSFDVPYADESAAWRVENQCGSKVKVEVTDFKDHGVAGVCWDVMKACYLLEVAPGEELPLVCLVDKECAQDSPYDYSVYVNDVLVKDPQVVIKRDKGGPRGNCQKIRCRTN